MAMTPEISLLSPFGTWLAIGIIAGWCYLIWRLCEGRIRR
jgi:hypothetical protein